MCVHGESVFEYCCKRLCKKVQDGNPHDVLLWPDFAMKFLALS